MTELLQFDEQLFHFINSGCQNRFFDGVMPLLRNKYTWMPLYMFLLSFLLINFKTKGFLLAVSLLLTIGLADVTSSQLIKKTVKRLRPCKVIEPSTDLHLLVKCGSGYSFPSTHATNHFAIAVFLGLTLGKVFRWVRPALLVWAFSISFAQVYVGLHYPLDVMAGSLLGSLIGWAGYVCFRRFISFESNPVND